MTAAVSRALPLAMPKPPRLSPAQRIALLALSEGPATWSEWRARIRAHRLRLATVDVLRVRGFVANTSTEIGRWIYAITDAGRGALSGGAAS